MMPPTITGVILTALMLAVGIGLIVYRGVHKVPFWKNIQYFRMSIIVLVVAYLGVCFYDHWSLSSKIQAIATMLHTSFETILLICTIIISVLSIYFFDVLLQIIAKKLFDINPKNIFLKCLLSSLIASVIMVMLANIMAGVEAFSMGSLKFFFGVLIVLVVILFLYCLLGRIVPSIFIGTAIFMIISTINVYVYKFRGRLFEPVDIFSASTAMNVAENYSFFPLPFSMIVGWGVFIAMLTVVCRINGKVKLKLSVKGRLGLFPLCIISSVAIFFYASTLKTYHWHNDGALFNGYILDFVSKFKEISVSEPDQYSVEQISKLADRYEGDDYHTKSKRSEQPHIIVIMDEAFSDLGVVGKFSTNMEDIPFISSLKENTISGYALTSVYGGNTANSEYEFLTGNSMAWLAPNVVPYQQYIRSSTYSMASYLKSSHNYTCVAMHPFQAEGWNRPTAYEHLGFDECYFVEDFPQENFVREYVSDKEMFRFLIETYETKKENPLFLFGVTMQNHGSYNYTGKNYTKTISLNQYGDKYPDVEQYLSLVHETDKAVEYLLSYFQNIDDNVVIVFFGDHQPKLRESFYQTMGGTTAATLDEKQKRYKVPFFIWANYDIEEAYVDCTSLNYLSSYVYQAAGITLPPYNRFLQEMEKKIPSINAIGFYSLINGCYMPFEEANKEELEWLELYEALQYNCIFDHKYRSKTFFSVTK